MVFHFNFIVTKEHQLGGLVESVTVDMWVLILSHAITGLGLGALGFRIGKKQSVIGRGSVSDQNGASANGDIVGRDKISR